MHQRNKNYGSHKIDTEIMSSLQHKVIWITGASSGIGEALVYECAKQNAKIILSARRESELARVAKSANLNASNSLVLPFDLSNTSQANELAQKSYICFWEN